MGHDVPGAVPASGGSIGGRMVTVGAVSPGRGRAVGGRG